MGIKILFAILAFNLGFTALGWIAVSLAGINLVQWAYKIGKEQED